MRKRNNKVRKNKDYNAIPSIIPDIVFYDDNLSSGAKVFYGMVVFLYRDSLRCNASTYYFYTQLGRTAKYAARSIQLYISELYEKKFISVKVKDGARYITPVFLPENDSDIASYIPPEVVKDSDLSSSDKLTYGLLNYRSANENGYYETSITDIAIQINKSKATVYRHLKTIRRLQYAATVKTETGTQIYSYNSYQDTFKKKQATKLKKSQKDPPNKITTLSDDKLDYLRQLVGR